MGGIAGFLGGDGAAKDAYNVASHSYLFKAEGKYVLGQTFKTNVLRRFGDGLKIISTALVRGLLISAATTMIGSPIVTLLSSLYESSTKEECDG